MAKRMRTRNQAGGQMSEMPVALFILFFFFLFPLINMVFIGMAAVTIYFATVTNVTRAAKQPDFTTSLSAFFDEASLLNGSGMIQFLKMTPYAGYKGCGSDLFITATDTGTGTAATFGPNTGVTGPVDPNARLYEYRGVTAYDVQPFINLGAVPFLTGVPGIGAPFRLSFSAHSAAEHPTGLATANNPTLLSGGTPGISLDNPPGLDPASVAVSSGGTTWLTPDVFQTIDNSGATINDQTVLSVAAREPDWTHTSVQVSDGDKIYIDYKADGSWQNGVGSLVPSNADGANSKAYDDSIEKQGYMIGKLGSTEFLMGKSQQMVLAPSGQSGELLIANFMKGGPSSKDTKVRKAYKNNKGTMDVRIIVVR